MHRAQADRGSAMAGSAGQAGERAAPPDAGAVRAELVQILAGPGFAASRQNAALLTYLVEETLAGRAGRLKAYTLATEALGRAADFDPQADASVRVAVNRLRRTLDAHYGAAGRMAALRIRILPGSYAPLFEAAPGPGAPPKDRTSHGRPSTAARWAIAAVLALLLGGIAYQQHAASPGGAAVTAAPSPPREARPSAPPLERLPRLAVLAETGDEAASALAQRLRTVLARFSEITVVDGAEANYIVAVRAVGPEVLIELRDQEDGEVLAGYRGQGPLSEQVLRFAVTAIAQPYGLIATHERVNKRRPEGAFHCLLGLMEYWRSYDAAQLPAIEACLRTALARDPEFGPLVSAQALVRLEAHRLPPAPDPAALEDSLVLAIRAIRLAPYDSRVRQGLAAALYTRGDATEAIATLEAARELNPWDPLIQADLAVRRISEGQHDEGLRLLAEACRFVVARPAWIDFGLFAGHLLAGDKPAALHRADAMAADFFELNLLARAIAAGLEGRTDRRAALWASLLQRDPAWETDPARALGRYGFGAAVTSVVTAALAGRLPAAAAPLAPVSPIDCAAETSPISY